MISIHVAKSDELNQNIVSTTAYVKIGKAPEITKQEEPVFRNVICNFSVTPIEGLHSSPSLILAGKVVSNNTGFPQEFVPIFFGSTLHLPRLAALTNANGEFSFRVWVSKPDGQPLSHRLAAADISDSTLYLGGEFNEKAEMVSSKTHIHSLGEFLKKTPKQKK